MGTHPIFESDFDCLTEISLFPQVRSRIGNSKSMAKPNTDLPEKWLDFSPIGTVIEGTNIIVCKTPLKTELLTNVPEDSEHLFKPSSIPEHLEKYDKKVGLVIDLTNTSRYYHPLDIKDIKSDFYKMAVTGTAIPDECYIHQFIKVIDNFN